MRHFLTSSKFLFSLALILIVGTGSFLVLNINLYEQQAALNSTFVASTKDEPEAIAEQADDEEEKPEEQEQIEQPVVENEIYTFNCNDCSLAAVDKEHSLPSSYYPSLIETGLAGGGMLTSDTATALTSMFEDAKNNESLDLEIISAFRSYDTQAATFEYWVQQEINSGLSRAAAEAEANTYSAKPGQSEHQLGTTADIRCLGCASFDATQNADVYDYIEDNAHKFGFVISYPMGQDSLTGYIYEPWHIRYIGVDLATELYDTGYTAGNGNYLAKFLRDKGLST